MTDAPTTLESLRITGSVGTGKTQHLVERVATLLTEGASTSDILVLCATPQAARIFSDRLTACAGLELATKATVITPRALALEVLSNEEALGWSGREPRLLAEFEEKFLMEDMKVSGLRPRRLREMLKFFYRSWSELADDDPAWLLPGEEADVHALLKANLAFMRAVVEPEAANLAVNFLRSHENTRSVHVRAHVLVDDYQRLSRASQILANLVAAQSITIAGDTLACVKSYDSYPYAAGLDEFIALHPNARTDELILSHNSHGAARAAQAVLADPDIAGSSLIVNPTIAPDETTVLISDSPTDEFGCIAQLVADTVKDGTATSDIVVAVPNGTWARNVVAALRDHNLRAEALAESQPIRGDIRDNARCVPARVMTALDLAANPKDAAAWRCWCGYGDYLVNSAAIASIRAFTEEQGIGLVEALDTMSSKAEAPNGANLDHVVGAQRVAAAYQAGRKLIEQAGFLTGQALLNELAHLATDGAEATAPATLVNLCLVDNSDEDSAEVMARRARERLLAPQIADAAAVAVVPYDLTVGFSPALLVVSGFVNGFIPCRDYFDSSTTPLDKQEKIHAEDARRVYSLIGKAKHTLALSYFTSIDLEGAGALKLKINRIRMDHGMRICAIAPSEFLEQILAE